MKEAGPLPWDFSSLSKLCWISSLSFQSLNRPEHRKASGAGHHLKGHAFQGHSGMALERGTPYILCPDQAALPHPGLKLQPACIDGGALPLYLFPTQ